jgi:hypothetical protein
MTTRERRAMGRIYGALWGGLVKCHRNPVIQSVTVIRNLKCHRNRCPHHRAVLPVLGLAVGQLHARRAAGAREPVRDSIRFSQSDPTQLLKPLQ